MLWSTLSSSRRDVPSLPDILFDANPPPLPPLLERPTVHDVASVPVEPADPDHPFSGLYSKNDHSLSTPSGSSSPQSPSYPSHLPRENISVVDVETSISTENISIESRGGMDDVSINLPEDKPAPSEKSLRSMSRPENAKGEKHCHQPKTKSRFAVRTDPGSAGKYPDPASK